MYSLPFVPDQRPKPPDDQMRAERLEALSRVLSPEGPPRPGEQAPPVSFAALGREEAADEWGYLRAWVEALVARFPHLSPGAVPPCWYRHPGHVDALMALCDFHRACYGRGSLPTEAVRWHRAFRDVEDRLRVFTADSRCTDRHHCDPQLPAGASDDEWASFLQKDLARRPSDETFE